MKQFRNPAAPCFALLLASCAITACDDGSQRVTAPQVAEMQPASGATLVPDTTTVRARFNRPMNASTFTPDSFTLACAGAAVIDATVAYDSATHTATLSPTSPLPPDVDCTATISTAVTDGLAIHLASDVSWTFGTTFDPALVEQGKQIFRYDTFGDETQWTDTLRMHEVIRSAVDPLTALVGRTEGGRRGAARRGRGRHPGRQHQPEQPGDHGRAAQARRGRRRQGHGRERSTARTR